MRIHRKAFVKNGDRSFSFDRLCCRVVHIALLVMASYQVSAQQLYIPFRHLSTADGLSQDHVETIYQDHQGFIWLGTHEGLNRYDGYDFKTYFVDDISCIIGDEQGQIWFSTGNGLHRFDLRMDSITKIQSDGKNGMTPGKINEILFDRTGNLWMVFVSGDVNVLKRNDTKFTALPEFFRPAHQQTTYEATALCEDLEGNMWVGTQNGVAVMGPDLKLKRRYFHDANDPHSIAGDAVLEIFMDRQGIIWLGTKNGLSFYNAEHDRFTTVRHDEKDPNSLWLNIVKRIAEDAEGRLWIGTENGGLDVWDRTTNVFHHFQHNPMKAGSISENSIYCIFRDRQNSMWVGTNSQGVNFYDRQRKPFTTFQNVPGNESTLSHNKVTSVVEEPGKGFWIATDGGGVNFFDRTSGAFKSFKVDSHVRNSVQSDYVVDVVWDPMQSCVWIATWAGGLSRLDPQTGVIKNYRHDPHDPKSISTDNLWTLHLDRDGTLYIGTLGGGMNILYKGGTSFQRYSAENGLNEKNVVDIYRDRSGILWLGGWLKHLEAFEITPTSLKSIRHIPVQPLQITEDTTGVLWVGGSQGFTRYDLKNDSIKTFTAADGLPGTSVNMIVNDQLGNFWLGTNKGLVKFDVGNNQFTTFTYADGLPTNQFTAESILASNGELYIGSVLGLIVFSPDSIKRNLNIPFVSITDFKIYNRSVVIGGEDHILDKHISETREIWLSYDQNFFAFNFVALNYTSSEKNEYAYKLEGFDKDWIDGSSRVASYTSVDPGTYHFKVKASNNDGVWNERGVDLVIHVLPPWWETVWAKILFFALGMLIVAAIIRIRIHTVNKRNKMLNILVEEKTKELQMLNVEMDRQNKTLLAHEYELGVKNDALEKSKEEIEMQNEALRHGKEEISAQRDLLWSQNQKLEEAQVTIESQNQEIKQRNENLELEVESRTKELAGYVQQLEQFAFISAHNLRAPVARILGLGKILELSPSDGKMVFDKMVFTAKELDRVVRDLNTILEVKKNAGGVIHEINMKEILMAASDGVEKEINDAHAEIQFDFTEAPRVLGIKPYVESIFTNLLSNAIKYRHPRRRPLIRVSTAKAGDFTCLTFTDNGLGMDEDVYRDKIFSLYQRFHDHVDGKGLGLYLIKTQIVAMGGRIEVQSKVDEGTTFKVFFKGDGMYRKV